MDRRNFVQHVATLTFGATPSATKRRTRSQRCTPRAHDRPRMLNTALEPLRDSTGVAELRERLTTTAA